MPGNAGEYIRVLVLGDAIGKSGCRALFSMVKSLKKEFNADCVIANGENAHDGSGMTPEIVSEFFNAGIDVITSGNHIWREKSIYPVLEKEERLLRPENYPKGVPGNGVCSITCRDVKLTVINLEGNLNQSRLRCPFQVGRECVERSKKESSAVIIDFHAESAQEKEALAVYLDGSVSLVFGTHTHVQTADERILAGGTGFITDIGMTGPRHSVIGMSPKIAVDRAVSQMPLKLEVMDGPAIVMGIVVDIDVRTGKSIAIKRFQKNSSL